jgi:protoporphyrinogen oxidase
LNRPLNKFWAGNIDLTSTVHIYGGGISGLIAAYQLKKAGVDFKLFEITDRLGGKIQTKSTSFGLVETGANAIVINEAVKEILDDLKLKYEPVKPKLKRLIYRNSKIRNLPAISPIEFLKIAARSLKKISKNETESIYETFSPWLGNEVTNQILTPALRGIYATGATSLHTDSVIKGIKSFRGKSYFQFARHKLQSLKKQGGVKSYSFQGGMQELIDALGNFIEGHYQLEVNEPLHPNSLICTNPFSASVLLKNKFPQVSEKLAVIKQSSIFSTNIFCDFEIPAMKNAFGLLFNIEDSYNIMGVLANHEIFSMREESKTNRPYSYTIISKTKLEKIHQEFLAKVFSFTAKQSATFWEKPFEVSYEYGLPLFDYSRTQIIHRIEQSAQGIGIWGNYVDGISLRSLLGG